jgi:RNA ligase
VGYAYLQSTCFRFGELQALLTKVKYVEGEDVVIFTGDLVDRGPKIREVLDFVRHTPYVYSVMSNHEHKYLRYLRGNKVNTFSLRETRSQVIDSLDTRMFLESLPYIIKWDTNNYVVHAGIHPEADITNQRKDILLYARTYNPKTNNFTEEGQRPWYEFPIRKGYKIYFGHQITDIMDVASSSYALDGGCVHGGELRGLVISADRQEEQLYIQPSSFKYKEDTTTSLHYSLEPYEALVSQGYLSKQEKNNKVLYKYTDKTTFEKHWNEYTRSARGIIFDKETGACLARPFKKFFNINEMPETSFSKLPNEAYQIFEKMDGSLGITYWENNNPILATCGSFNSDQAIKGTQILRKKYDFWMMDPQYTYLFEIIYPSNKIVVNYGDTEELVLLSAFNTKTGEEVNREWLTSMSVRIGCPLVSVHNLDIQQALTLQKTLPKDREGFIVRYNSGLRIKIKGAEYLRYHRIISGLTPLNIWRELKEGILPLEYKMHIPEEVLSEVEVIEQKLSLKYEQVKKEIENEINTYFSFVDPTNLNKKEIGLKLKEVEKLLKHPIAIFPYFLGKGLETYIMKAIEPKANIL